MLDENIGVAGPLGIPEDLVQAAAGARSGADLADPKTTHGPMRTNVL
ncbi:MAG: hypothetical protein H0T49_01275 [Chloroflexia bacterium]|nr:hypothetical protein [Chloroflexia bacterium]